PPLDATAVPVGLPSATITREAAAAFAPRARARLRVDLDDEEQRGVNVIGIVPGTDPALAAEAVVVGAHYDHLGYQGGVMYPGACSGSGVGDALAAAARGGVRLDVRGSPDGPSDHTRFYEAGVPVLFFTAGRHPDYHQPTDTADRIDAAGMARIAVVALHAIERLAGDARPTYVKAAPRPSSQGGTSGGAFLGALVDPRMAGDGLKLSATLP